MARPLRNPAKVKAQYLTPGFHSDVVWLEDQRDYAEVLMGCARQYLDGCRADPGYGVFLHELTYLKPYIDTNPGEADYIRMLIQEGRVGTGGAHSLPSETIISGEGIIRNIIQGRRYHEDFLGDRPWVLMLWDIFGHVSQIPQIALGCRFRAVIWSKNIRGARPLFYQLGPDGSKVLVRRMSYSLPNEGMERDLEFLRSCIPEMESLGLPADLRLDCNDFRPPRAWVIGRTSWLASLDPPIIVSGQAHRRFFEDVFRAERRGELFIPTVARDFEWHHQGTGVAHIDLKILNRLCENSLVNAEKLAAFASLMGAEYPWHALDKAWRQVLFAQHHDAITGPCCDRSYFDLMDGYRDALELAWQVIDNSAAYLARAINTARDGALACLVVFNTLNWQRTDIAEAEISFGRPVRSFALIDAAGREVPFEIIEANETARGVKSARVRMLVTVPGLGYTTVWAIPSDRPLPRVQKLPAADTVEIENEFYRLRITKACGGGIESLYDKQLGRELINSEVGPGNELISIEEDIADHPEPPWEVMTKVGGQRYHSRDFPARLEVFQGPVTTRVRVSGRFKDCRRVQEIVLIRGLRRIEFITELHRYRGKEHLHVIAFPVKVPGAVPVFDDRFSCLVKRKSRGYMDFRTWQWRNYSDCGARHLYQWIDFSHSAAIRFGGGAAVALGPVSVVIPEDRDVEEAAYPLQEALIRLGVPCTIFYDTCERDRRRNLPHQDSVMPEQTPNEDLPWGTAFRFILDVGGRNSYLRQLLQKLPASARRKISAQRKQNGAAIAFVYERDIEMDLWDEPTPHPWPPLPTVIISAEDEDALRRAVADLAAKFAEGPVAELPAECNLEGPQDLADFGIALLNRGTPLCSVENNDTMALIFMHSVRWSRAHLDFKPVAEHKTHRFEYALYPHAGTWREGRVPWAAYEYNNRLLAVQADASPGELPAEGQLLSLSDSVIITALKAEGYPLAAFDSPPDRVERLALRFYEPLGRQCRVRLSTAWGIEAAWRANMLEEPQRELKPRDGRLSLRAGGFAIETLLIKPGQAPQAGPAQLGPKAEPIQPVYFKHWEHNNGAAPIGYAPLGINLRAIDLRTDTHVRQGGWTVNRIGVALVNNTSEQIEGVVRFVVPDGWRVEPAELPFTIGPRASGWLPVTLLFESDLRRGAVRAQVEYEGQTYEAVLEVGEPAQIDWQIRRTARGAQVIARTDYPHPIDAEVTVVVPHELWGRIVEGAEMGLVEPRKAKLTVQPGKPARLNIQVAAEADAWLTVKLAYHGRVDYKQIRL